MNRRIAVGAATALVIVACLIAFKPVVLGFKPYIKANAAVLLDMDSGSIWLNKNGDEPMPAASVSKLMTEMIVLDHISAGKTRWDDRVHISAYASTAGGVTLSLKQGESYTVRELFEGISIYSANDAALALAEHLAGSEPSFVILMNDKARSLGMSPATIFANATGLPVSDVNPNRPPGQRSRETVMTAKDTARLAAALIDHHPEVLGHSSRTQMQLKGKGLYVSNTNLMLPAMGGAYAYEGTDGLKTGYDTRTGYCIAGTAERGGRRMIAVVMGAETRHSRFEGAASLFDYGFYKTLPAGERMKWIMHALGFVTG
ncbi:D-alanyl-D-alanine carboxypeptidase [Paenibacillus albidus]|uniref:D-alanyl-D-alanine carboxypeptidase n=1 Tax=Paenibacillus albidus TaxID=2041023 RepID=A0A917CQJ2_9BACL|nr:D-alanyl-D-alanine carboxypeptidase family protein [Paenibacillus albidus]GGF95390.1 D-alanyl-D-alanine carboxypeptidase [Paenibacillus albidus]